MFRIYLWTLKKAHHKFIQSLADPEISQQNYFKDLIAANQLTRFGKKHHFSESMTIADFQKLVPVQSYGDIQADMDQVFTGREDVLVSSPIKIFEKTSGTTSKNKIIPFTERFLTEVSQSTSAWIYQTFLDAPDMIGKKLYYSISPQMREREFSPSNIPIGMADDTEYLGALGKFFVHLFMAVPTSIGQITDPQQWQRATLLHLVECRDLGFISLWSPTLLQVWIRFLETADDEFFKELSLPAQERLRKCQNLKMSLKELWPDLTVVSFWTDGPSALFFDDLRPFLRNIQIQSKGLMATEGIVSIPMGMQGGSPLAVHCQFLEFIDLDQQEIKLVHELQLGKRYSPVISNSAGLYRYHLKDIIECTGFFENTPLVRFVGKLESVSDLCGEKLSTEQVLSAIEDTQRELQIEMKWMQILASQKARVGYVVLTHANSQDLSRIEEVLDQKLRKNIHYDYARKLGQLDRIRSYRFELSYLQDQYQNFMISEKIKVGDIKFQPLMPHDRFLTYLEQKESQL
ncbi:MAG: GH3 auxin-responsive promoter family protein [Pseudobdellovibrionaceae bacterium]